MKWNLNLKNKFMQRFKIVFCCLFLFFLKIQNSKAQNNKLENARIVRSNNFSLAVSLSDGGRIISFQLLGKEILTQSETEPLYFGSTLWIAPENIWWPVNAILDSSLFSVVNQSASSIHLISPPIKNGIQVEKKIEISEKDSSVHIEYMINNVSSTPFFAGAWELVRTPGGKSFFPYDKPSPIKASDLKNVVYKNGLTAYYFDKKDVKSPQKLYASAKEGWLAHFSGDLLFIKTFPDIEPGKNDKGQGEVEIYVNEKASYVELETHGLISKIKPGEQMSYKTKWYLAHYNKKQDINAAAAYVRKMINDKSLNIK